MPINVCGFVVEPRCAGLVWRLCGGWNPQRGFRHDNPGYARGYAVDPMRANDELRNDGLLCFAPLSILRTCVVASVEDGIPIGASVMTIPDMYPVEPLIRCAPMTDYAMTDCFASRRYPSSGLCVAAYAEDVIPKGLPSWRFRICTRLNH